MRPVVKIKRRACGFTLLETLLALSVLALVFASIVGLQLTSVTVTSESREATDATEIANEVLMTLEGAVYASSTTAGTTTFAISDYLACPGTSLIACSGSGPLPDTGQFPTLSAQLYPQLDRYSYTFDVVGLQQASGSFLDEGLVRITVSLQGPSNVTLATIATCYDAARTPTIDVPQPCPTPTN